MEFLEMVHFSRRIFRYFYRGILLSEWPASFTFTPGYRCSIPMKIIEVQSDIYLDKDDVVRFKDHYGRVKQ